MKLISLSATVPFLVFLFPLTNQAEVILSDLTWHLCLAPSCYFRISTETCSSLAHLSASQSSPLFGLSLSCSRAKFLENVVYIHCLCFLPLHPLPTTHFLLDSDPFFSVNLSSLPVSLSLNSIGLLKSFIVLNTQHC